MVKLLEDNDPQVLKEAGDILLRLIGNVLKDPQNVKYRSIRLSNPKIESKLLAANGAMEILFAVGFEEATDSLVLPLDAALPDLRAYKAALEEVMWGRGGDVPNPGAGSSSAGATAAPPQGPRKPDAEPEVMQTV